MCIIYTSIFDYLFIFMRYRSTMGLCLLWWRLHYFCWFQLKNSEWSSLFTLIIFVFLLVFDSYVENMSTSPEMIITGALTCFDPFLLCFFLMVLVLLANGGLLGGSTQQPNRPHQLLAATSHNFLPKLGTAIAFLCCARGEVFCCLSLLETMTVLFFAFHVDAPGTKLGC